MEYNGNNGLSKVYVGFVDTLSAIIIGISFTEFTDFLIPLTLPPKFETVTLFLAYSTIILSWLGYHRTIEKQPHKNVNRFILDVIVQFLYFYLLYSIKVFSTIVLLIPIIFGVYLLWSFAREREYPSKSTGIFGIPTTVVNTARYLLIFTVIAVIYHAYVFFIEETFMLKWSTLILLIAIVISYDIGPYLWKRRKSY